MTDVADLSARLAPRSLHERTFARPVRAANVPTVPWSATATRWLRRLHLWSGVALVPFVLVYGISAFLFNHGGAPAAPERTLSTAPVAVDTAALDATVAAALGHAASTVGAARLDGDWVFELTTEGRRHRLTIPAGGGAASLRALPERGPRPERLPAGTFAAANGAALAAARATLTTHGVDAGALEQVAAPTLRFEHGERGECETSATLARGQVTQRAAGLDVGRLLMRLHTAHGYGGATARVVWAVVVDVMAAAMVLWSVSGVVMWWQRRSQRVRGLLLLAATTAALVVLATALHALRR
jgi:hypothetical protein